MLIDFEFWRKQFATYAEKGREIKNCGNMCKTCAFRLDSDANIEPQTIESVYLTMADETKGRVFNCHTKDLQDSGQNCKGWLHAKQYLNEKFKNEED